MCGSFSASFFSHLLFACVIHTPLSLNDDKDQLFFGRGCSPEGSEHAALSWSPPVCLACVYLFLCSSGINYHNHMPG